VAELVTLRLLLTSPVLDLARAGLASLTLTYSSRRTLTLTLTLTPTLTLTRRLADPYLLGPPRRGEARREDADVREAAWDGTVGGWTAP
jgi:hypothetical protein